MNPIRISNRLLGPGQPCFLAAEIGINHNGDMDLACRMIDAAAEAGADAVKFQNYRTEEFIGDRTLTYQYESQGQMIVESQYDMFKRYELAPESLLGLRRHCELRGVIFFSTPSGQQGIDDLVRVGAPLLKNGSDYLGNLQVVRAMACTGLPTILSTGMATLAEIDEAVRTFRQAGGRQLILLQCTSSYPTPPEDVHLRKIPVLAAAFGCPVGLSDHTFGTVAALGAVALGACFIEKHFTLDKTLPGPDHRFSADPQEFKELAGSVRILERELGQSAIGPTRSEAQGLREFKLSCVAAVDLRAGHVLAEADIAFRRPGTGLPPAAAAWLASRRLGRDVRSGKVFEPGDLD